MDPQTRKNLVGVFSGDFVLYARGADCANPNVSDILQFLRRIMKMIELLAGGESHIWGRGVFSSIAAMQEQRVSK